MNRLNLKHLVRRALRRESLDFLADGRIHMAQDGSFLGGSFRARYAPPGGDFGAPVISHNRVVGQGLVHLLNLLGGHAAAAQLYIAPWNTDVEPQADWTGANFDSNAGEFTNYTPTTRVPWNTQALTTVANLNNSAALAAATITLTGAGPYTIRGAALIEGSVKESTTGKLIVASRFPDDLTGMMTNGRLSLEYSLVAMDEADAP
jgi:hypothetical protein